MLAPPAGSVGVTVPVPNDPGLRGLGLFVQSAGLDPAAFRLAFFSAAVPGTVGF